MAENLGAKTGKQYKERLQKAQNVVYANGEKVDDVTTHPAFKNVVDTMAKLYDVQHEKPDKMLYTSPTSGKKVGMTYLHPTSIEDLIKRREAIQEWARTSHGMMGRAPDYLNTEVMAMGMNNDLFAEADPRFAQNARDYYDYARENDISLTHTLIHPQINRSKDQFEQKDPHVSLHLVEEKSDGIIVNGIRLLATQGAITDETLVFPSTFKKAGEKDDPFSLAFVIENNAPGIKQISREPWDYKDNKWDYPLSSRFEEGDTIVSFDNVFVPWEKVFVVGNSDVCNRTFSETNAVVHMSHQVVSKAIVKTEFILGVALSIMDAIGIDQFQHVKDKGRDIMITLENMRSHLYRAEHNAKIDKFGTMNPDFEALDAARNWFPRIYPDLAEIIRVLSASGLTGIPTEADFANEDIGDILDRGLQGANLNGYDRVQLFRLAWDLTSSAFGARQTHYEYYFFGDPVRMGMVYFDRFDKEPYKQLVTDFLAEVKKR